MTSVGSILACVALLAAGLAHRAARSANRRAEDGPATRDRDLDRDGAAQMSHSHVPIPAVPPHPSLALPPPWSPVSGGVPVDSGDVIDVRIHGGAPSPPMDPWALAAGAPFRQIGFVYSNKTDTRLPLYGRAAPFHSSRMQYYVSTRDANIQVSARVNDKDCAERLGCEELYNGDTVTVPEIEDEPLTVKLYAQ